jgi:hypothetical protein
MSDLERIEQELIDISGNQWKEITVKVMWIHRLKHIQELPPILNPILDTVLDPERWKILRNQINRKRKTAYRQKLKERRDTKALERRNYMRSYMANYRKRD